MAEHLDLCGPGLRMVDCPGCIEDNLRKRPVVGWLPVYCVAHSTAIGHEKITFRVDGTLERLGRGGVDSECAACLERARGR